MIEKITRMDEKIAQAEAAIQPLDEALQQAERELEAANQAVVEANAGVDRLNDEKEEIKGRHNETKNELRDHQVPWSSCRCNVCMTDGAFLSPMNARFTLTFKLRKRLSRRKNGKLPRKPSV